jgi:hypothetical protein
MPDVGVVIVRSIKLIVLWLTALSGVADSKLSNESGDPAALKKVVSSLKIVSADARPEIARIEPMRQRSRLLTGFLLPYSPAVERPNPCAQSDEGRTAREATRSRRTGPFPAG